MRVLTKTALGALINRTPIGINLHLEDAHRNYLASETVGDAVVWDSEFLHYKQDTPLVVEEWLRSFGFFKTFDRSCDFVIASVLDLHVEFLKDGEQKYFAHNKSTYKRALHGNAQETNIDGLYRIPVKGKKVEISRLSFHEDNSELKLYISTQEININTFKEPISDTYEMDLHVPYSKAEVEEEISIFNGMNVDFHGDMKQVGSAGVITKFNIDNKGAEAKQAAYMTSFSSCCTSAITPVRQRRVEVIDSNYFVYLVFKDSLAFAVEIEPKDFIVGNGEIDTIKSREPEVSRNEHSMDFESLLNWKKVL